MSKTKPKTGLVFFGAGPVAAESLRLLAKNFEIEAVITKPIPQGHRGDYPTLKVAEELGLAIYTPTNKKELSALFKTNPVTSTTGVVIDYGIIIAQDVIDYFANGIVNSHFSLLPQWRGADPITFSLLSGQKQTGVSLMLITAGLDEGPVFAWGVYDIKPTDNNQSLTHQLIYLSDALLWDALPKYLSGEFKPTSQESAATMMNLPITPSFSRKLTKADGLIDWQKPATQIECEIRAYSAWPKSYTNFKGLDVVITQVYVVPTNIPNSIPGTTTIVPEAKMFMVECGKGSLCIQKLKPAGKAEMSAASFINGYTKYI